MSEIYTDQDGQILKKNLEPEYEITAEGLKVVTEREAADEAPFAGMFQDGQLTRFGPGEVVVLPFDLQLPAGLSEETYRQVEKAMSYAEEYLRLFASKQEAYGRGNIAGFGELGVLVRLNDKLERLKNLVYLQRSTDLESVRDTWLDVLGYGLIGLMVHDGAW
ncbi:hypothetical protein [Meiothermus granaticius]|uniref:Nucleotide modification associated domain-containing protein n=1 Tax=Meiothermus granaticius NBRC 107808 TaxID=1227551 RepID=A0A399FCN1_9DEIN|nr:hypothetical protein [Meiothermus granaticius]RIH94000.1 hypothetical protein Mgrana_00086 [Meiothermus granaticius NBRC 107808]GEM88171.1 hypothetical protein MGR01S_27960 [Meiothermus granaticius NBRC 107808]